VVARSRKAGVYLGQVVAAAVQALDLGIAPVGHQGGQLGRALEEVLAVVATVAGRQGLVLAVDHGREGARQGAGGIARKQRVPVAAPQHLDHVPAGTGEQRLELLHDLAVAAHRAVQALQVAVDDEHQVVHTLARGQGEGGDGLGFVHLAVTEKAPDLAHAGMQQAAVFQVLHEARLVDRLSGPRPIEPVGNCQKSGISQGCGYDDSPRAPAAGACTSRR
jgi:hypothetical protein